MNGKKPSDRVLMIGLVKNRLFHAFELLVERHKNMVYAVCLRILNDSETAASAAQGVFMAFAQEARRIPQTVHPGLWLYDVALQTAENTKGNSFAPAPAPYPFPQGERRNNSDFYERIKDVRPVEKTIGSLDAAVVALPKAFRQIIILHCFEKRSLAETAVELGCSLGVVKASLAQALEALGKSLSRSDPVRAAADVFNYLSESAEVSAPKDFVAVAVKIFVGQSTPSPAAQDAAATTLRAIFRKKLLRTSSMAIAAVVLFALCAFLLKTAPQAGISPADDMTGGTIEGRKKAEKFDFEIKPSANLKNIEPLSFVLTAAGKSSKPQNVEGVVPALRELRSNWMALDARPVRVMILCATPQNVGPCEYGIELLDQGGAQICLSGHRRLDASGEKTERIYRIGDVASVTLPDDRFSKLFVLLLNPNGRLEIFPSKLRGNPIDLLPRRVDGFSIRLYVKADGTSAYCRWEIRELTIQRLDHWPIGDIFKGLSPEKRSIVEEDVF